MSDQDVEMTFTEHLRELRTRMIRAIAALGICLIASYIFYKPIIDWLKRPVESAGVKFQALRPFEIPILSLKVSLFAGLIIAFPFIIYQAFMFILPALKPKEKRLVLSFLLYGSIAAYVSIIFTNYVVLPKVLPTLITLFNLVKVEFNFSIKQYVSEVVRFFLLFMIAFQLPIAVLILTKIGIVSIDQLRRYRGFVIIGIFVAASLLTPPDVISQLVLGIPMIILYELGIIFARIFVHRPDKTET